MLKTFVLVQFLQLVCFRGKWLKAAWHRLSGLGGAPCSLYYEANQFVTWAGCIIALACLLVLSRTRSGLAPRRGAGAGPGGRARAAGQAAARPGGPGGPHAVWG